MKGLTYGGFAISQSVWSHFENILSSHLIKCLPTALLLILGNVRRGNFVLADVLLVEAVYVKNMVKIMGSQDFTVM